MKSSQKTRKQLILITALSLTACMPPNQNTMTPSPQPSTQPAASSSPVTSPSAAQAEAAPLKIKIQGSPDLIGFKTQQNSGICLNEIRSMQTKFAFSAPLTAEGVASLSKLGFQSQDQQNFTLESPLKSLEALILGVEFTLQNIGGGDISVNTQFLDQSKQDMGNLSFKINYQKDTKHDVNVLFKAVPGQNSNQGCPILTADISGGSFQQAGGGFMLPSQIVAPGPQASSPPSSPSPEASQAPNTERESLVPPRNVQVVARSTNTLTLSWDIGDPKPHQYRVFLNGTEKAQNITNTNYTFSGLQSQTSYQLEIQAISETGESERVKLTGSTTSLGSTASGNFAGGGSSNAPAPVVAEPEQKPLPTITQLDAASRTPGQNLVITGTLFDADPINNTVTVGNTIVTVQEATTTSLKIKLPATIPVGNSPITVKVGEQTSEAKAFTVNATPQGITITGDTATSLGVSVSKAGDFNGDGVADVLLGASLGDGRSYLFYGSPNFGSSHFDLATPLDGTNGMVFVGSGNENAGTSVGHAGDFNQDGKDDLLIGATGSRRAYVLYGGSAGFNGASFNLSDLATPNNNNGFLFSGNNDNTGSAVGGVGDVNGDGKMDIAIGASESTDATGDAYVIFGTNVHTGDGVSLPGLNNVDGFGIPGETNDRRLGNAVSGIGDINGDGVVDLAIGGAGGSTAGTAGKAVILYGNNTVNAGSNPPNQTNMAKAIGDLDGSNGFTLNGASLNNRMGRSVTGLGDVNGDGRADFMVSESGTGKSYVIFGRADNFPVTNGVFDHTSLNGTNGFSLTATRSGNSVAGVGDVNGDGFNDMLVTDTAHFAEGIARAYLVFGRQNFAANIDLANDLDGSNGFQMLSPTRTNVSVNLVAAAAGDLNADGLADIILSSQNVLTSSRGQAYILFGSAKLGTEGHVGAGGSFNLSSLTP